jgi:hypothetical protein
MYLDACAGNSLGFMAHGKCIRAQELQVNDVL